jgi:2'-hydroxyisoflavone reductase
VKLLVLGGTRFLGRALVDAALVRNHEITLFNRGQNNPELFPQVEKLRGDRDGNLRALEGRSWDAVVDTCGYFPRVVRQSADLLADAVEHYTFISTISVYSEMSRIGIDEDSSVGSLDDDTVEEITGETYGPLKGLCERVVEERFPQSNFIPRPGLIVGPFDATDRFTYWPHRISRGGEVLAPGSPGRQIQFIDVRDLGEWIVRIIEERQAGIYNATGPDYRLSMEELLEACKVVSHNDATFSWLPDQFLLDQGVDPWIPLPLWVPEDGDSGGLLSVKVDKAVRAGLTFRTLTETVRDTLQWDATRPEDIEWRAGLTREREREVLAVWRSKSQSVA